MTPDMDSNRRIASWFQVVQVGLKIVERVHLCGSTCFPTMQELSGSIIPPSMFNKVCLGPKRVSIDRSLDWWPDRCHARSLYRPCARALARSSAGPQTPVELS
jgi:hypothetical protein